MRVVADTHAFHWYFQQPEKLSSPALEALYAAERTAGEGVVVSIATLFDFWYLVHRTNQRATLLTHLWPLVHYPDVNVEASAITVDMAERATTEPIARLPDPQDRYIVATAASLGLPLVTKDGPIHRLGAVETIW